MNFPRCYARDARDLFRLSTMPMVQGPPPASRLEKWEDINVDMKKETLKSIVNIANIPIFGASFQMRSDFMILFLFLIAKVKIEMSMYLYRGGVRNKDFCTTTRSYFEHHVDMTFYLFHFICFICSVILLTRYMKVSFFRHRPRYSVILLTHLYS